MLQKGCGYHLDLLVVLILIVLCSVFGLPWFVAATVLSINHVKSLTRESECSAPGEKPQFLGIRSVEGLKSQHFLYLRAGFWSWFWLSYLMTLKSKTVTELGSSEFDAGQASRPLRDSNPGQQQPKFVQLIAIRAKNLSNLDAIGKDV